MSVPRSSHRCSWSLTRTATSFSLQLNKPTCSPQLHQSNSSFSNPVIPSQKLCFKVMKLLTPDVRPSSKQTCSHSDATVILGFVIECLADLIAWIATQFGNRIGDWSGVLTMMSYKLPASGCGNTGHSFAPSQHVWVIANFRLPANDFQRAKINIRRVLLKS